ncbi:septum formation family protein [Corynebacterium aquilae]|uniref:Septum formation-related domain-containing protein n=1 Tax=Corynebacterium aquilae DSM 44791 TaxID=1431546 RepID=A0A1L7CIF7_9CORY|nr:septum formation family protein [Corynebacterium aquilae]APT85641.1 hypothetical protein CAQU_11985 [Corynebacterium aquilae DSM 44791]
MNNTWRSSLSINTALVAMLAGCAGVGSYLYASGEAPEAQAPADSETATTAAAAASSSADASSTAQAAPFTSADVGDCLTWEKGDGDKVRDFGRTDCLSPHRFEVSAREDLATYPASEFGPTSQPPELTRQAQLREELCKAPTIKYLEGRYDPVGRYSIASILPSAEAWKAGDRTMLCGVQVTDDSGEPILTEGSAREQDQARIAQAGECVAIDPANATHIVPCDQPHQYEVTQVVDLKPIFPEGNPSIEDQDAALKPICTQAALDYVGGDDNLYNSTLQPFWTTIPTNSWTGGSHTVNCALVFGNPDGSFAELGGSAKGAFTINGNPPPPMPVRNPLRNPQ